MPTPLPIACSLTDAEATERAQAWRELATASLAERSRSSDGIELRSRPDDGVERSLHALIAAEGECCPFLDFELTANAAEVSLRITGPPEARPILDGFLDAGV